MDTTDTTPAPAVGGRQVGQLLAGRYRLALFKGGDDVADVWHALDESTEKVVTLEILRERGNDAARQRFLAEAQRMAAIERPSVMRVAAIHNEATDTFIVFEHLIPLPVVLTGLTAVAKDARPATKAAEDKAAALAAAEPKAPFSKSPTLVAVAGPTRSAAATDVDVEAPPTIVDLDMPEPSTPPRAAITARLPEPMQEPMKAVSSALTSARSEASDVMGRATRAASDARHLFRELRLNTLVTAARALLPKRLDASPLAAFIASVVAEVRDLVGAAPSASGASDQGAPSKARATSASASGVAAGVGTALSTIASLAMSLLTASRPLIARARGNRFVLGGAALVLLAVVFVASPLDDAIANALQGKPTGSPAAGRPGGLAPAPFEVPPLGAYGAAFESQGPYPTTSPNGTVEWVVALRNTGSAGWYRGIEGAQAALALPDGAGVAVQSTEYVAPGQVGWFVVHFKARAEVGTYTVQLVPRIDGRGPLPDLGIYAVVTVAKNP